MSKDFLTTAFIKPEAIFHSYVLGYFIGIRWSMTPNGGLGNDDLQDIVKRYLNFACDKDEWSKYQILTVLKTANREDIRLGAKITFPSLFHKKRQRPLQIPDELADKGIKFDIELINKLKDEAIKVRKDFNMNTENTVMNNETQTNESVNTSTTNSNVSSNAARAEGFTLPDGVSLDELTLDNYKQKTGKRFRMTKEQKARVDAGTITRQEAFEEFINAVREANGGN